MGVLTEQLKLLSTHPNQFQSHAKASLRLLERRSRLAGTPQEGATPPLRGVHSEPRIVGGSTRRRPLKEVQSFPELGGRGEGPWPPEAKTPPVCAPTADTRRQPSPAAQCTGSGRVKLVSGCFQIPHPRKAETGGEDSFFVSPAGAGVADGVGEWEWRFRVNPRAFADELMSGAQASLERPPEEGAPPQGAMWRASAALSESYAATRAWGSATALVAALDQSSSELGIASLGDSGARHIRWKGQGSATIVGRTMEQQHHFNCPFQLARLPTPEDFPRLREEGKTALVAAVQRSADQRQDQPQDAALYSFDVAAGDLIVLGTDGVFDNLHDYELCELAQTAAAMGPPEVCATDPTELAAAIARAAFARACDGSAKTPFGKNAREAGLHHVGGKLDDITVLAAWVVEADAEC